MRKIRPHLRLTILCMLFGWITSQSIITSSRVTIGNFTVNSPSVKMHAMANTQNVNYAVLPGIVGAVGAYVGLLVVAYEAGYVLGRIGTALYYAVGEESLAQYDAIYDLGYQAHAFSQFDN
ncbi:hypothetical protein BH10PSE19_BH10PSE19_19410 [soil metagenome]